MKITRFFSRRNRPDQFQIQLCNRPSLTVARSANTERRHFEDATSFSGNIFGGTHRYGVNSIWPQEAFRSQKPITHYYVTFNIH